MSKVSIRYGSLDDIPKLIALEHDAGELFRSIDYDFCADGPARNQSEHMHGINKGVILIAEIPPQDIAGFALLWPVDEALHLTELSVAREFQSHGVGRKLLAAAEDWARENDFKETTLTSFRDVPWNAPFYAGHGFDAFSPSKDRIELAAIIADEVSNGFAVKPRVAMRKRIRE